LKKAKSSKPSRSTGRSEARGARVNPARKLVEFHPEDLRALEQLAEDKSSTLQELMDKAVRDFLDKSGRPTNLREALRKSATKENANEPQRRKMKKRVGSRT
jgi:hypothetical protein